MFGSDSRRIPLALKLFYFAYLCVLIPTYLHVYGIANFLWACDIALLLGAAAVFSERSLPASTASVGIIVGQLYWVIDLIANLCGYSLTGLTDYMFQSSIPLYVRLLSLYHAWLPFVLIYLLWKLGYDKRGLVCWTVLFWVVLLTIYILFPLGPSCDPAKFVNIDFVYGLGRHPQHLMPPLLWLCTMMAVTPLILYLPSHLVLKKLFRPA